MSTDTFTCYICDTELISGLSKCDQVEEGIYRCKCGSTFLDKLGNHKDRYIGLPPKESPMFATIFAASSKVLNHLRQEWIQNDKCM